MIRLVTRPYAMVSPRRRAVVWVQLSRTIEMIVQFVLGFLAARVLGPSQYGVVGVLTSVQAISVILIAAGFDEVVQRRVARRRDAFVSFGLYSLVARAIFSGVYACMAATVVCLHYSDSEFRDAIIWMSVYSVLTAFSSLILSLSLAVYRPLWTMAGSLFSWLPAVVYLCMCGRASANEYFLFLALGALVQLTVSVSWILWFVHKSVLQFDRRLFSGYDGIASHISLTVFNLNNQLLARHGPVLIGGLSGVGAGLLGTFSLAFQLTSTANAFLMLGIGALGLTRLSELTGDLKLLGLTWRRLLGFSAVLAAFPVYLVGSSASLLSNEFLSGKYPSFVAVLCGLAICQWINRIFGGGTNIGALIALDEMRAVALSSIFGVIVSLSSAYFLSLWVGVWGMVVGSALGYVVSGGWNMWSLYSITGARPPWASYFRLSVFALVGCAVGASGIGLAWVVPLALVVGVFWAVLAVRSVSAFRSESSGA